MWFVQPSWLWFFVAWCVTSVVVALGLGRWFRFMRDEDRDW